MTSLKSFFPLPLQPQQEDLQHGFWQVGRPPTYIASCVDTRTQSYRVMILFLSSILTSQPTGRDAKPSVTLQCVSPRGLTYWLRVFCFSPPQLTICELYWRRGKCPVGPDLRFQYGFLLPPHAASIVLSYFSFTALIRGSAVGLRLSVPLFHITSWCEPQLV